MNFREHFINQSLKNSQSDFNKKALELFHFQASENPIYRRYLKLLKRNAPQVTQIEDIPFLPISFFKEFSVVTGRKLPEKVFLSSGTGSPKERSKHLVADLSLYEWCFMHEYQRIYGKPEEQIILALLPSYQENEQSSLLYMVKHLMRLSHDTRSQFISLEFDTLLSLLPELKASGKKVILFGVAYALLELAEYKSPDLSFLTIIETGGMKGRRKELIKQELHQLLCNSFHSASIHSEYGMTELLSQAYSTQDGIFHPGETMRVLVRDVQDPFQIKTTGRGAINVIDLGNVDSCGFIETEDMGMLYPDGSFEILGRKDNSEARGCNMLYML